MEKPSLIQIKVEKSSIFICNNVAIMDKDLKTILKDEIDRRNSSIPLVAKELDIPRDRIYAWYRDGSAPKALNTAGLLICIFN